MVPGGPLRERSSPPDPGEGMGGMDFYTINTDSYNLIFLEVLASQLQV
jgi:hypothetical protein